VPDFTDGQRGKNGHVSSFVSTHIWDVSGSISGPETLCFIYFCCFSKLHMTK
jgi:hypothetical protein